MKTLLLLLVSTLAFARLDAAIFKLDGSLTYEITEPRCTFELDGTLQNISPSSTGSGTIKLVLWATPAPFPAAGYIIAEHTLGRIGGGSQFSDFKARTTSKIPAITGNYHLTIVVTELTTAGWRSVLAIPNGQENLKNGDFTDQRKWLVPGGPLAAPPAALATGTGLLLTLRATQLLNLLPVDAQEQARIAIKSPTRATVSNRSRKKPVPAIYTVRQVTLGDGKVTVGSLSLTYPDKTKATITLHFKTPSTGFYKSLESTPAGTEATWGDFTTE